MYTQTNIKLYGRLFLNLLKTDLLIFMRGFKANMIDSIFWISTLLLVTTYVFPALGMTSSFGSFIAVASIATASFFELYSFAPQLLSDIEGNNTMSYELTLPLPTWLIIIKHGVLYACKVSLLSSITLPFAKLLLWNRFDLSHISIIKTIIMFFSLHLFFAFFSVFITSMIQGMSNIRRVSNRIIFPLWFFGGAQFPWKALYSISPKLAYLCLLNPVIYAFEGIHSAVLNEADYLPFWLCLGVLWLMTSVFAALGIVKLKKRLDFV